jgi:hypothetical protein
MPGSSPSSRVVEEVITASFLYARDIGNRDFESQKAVPPA